MLMLVKNSPQPSALSTQNIQDAAVKGNAQAQNDLGGMFEKGIGRRQDFVEAVKWYRLAAEQGFATAQYN